MISRDSFKKIFFMMGIASIQPFMEEHLLFSVSTEPQTHSWILKVYTYRYIYAWKRAF
jgi:hypothetical protein